MAKEHGSLQLAEGSEGDTRQILPGLQELMGWSVGGMWAWASRRELGWPQPPRQLLLAPLGTEAEGPCVGGGLPRGSLWVQTLDVCPHFRH